MKLTKLKIFAASAILALNIGVYSAVAKDTCDYESCMEKYKDKVPGEDYSKGKILVGFDPGINEEQARQFIESYDELKMEPTWKFELTRFTIVKVPQGKEKKYACLLDSQHSDTIIDFAKLTY
jgi:hypothetical protein